MKQAKTDKQRIRELERATARLQRENARLLKWGEKISGDMQVIAKAIIGNGKRGRANNG